MSERRWKAEIHIRNAKTHQEIVEALSNMLKHVEAGMYCFGGVVGTESGDGLTCSCYIDEQTP